jgi:hypothetical protein
MLSLIHTLLREPILTLFTLGSILVVVGLAWSDWADKRREQEILALAKRSRQPHAQPAPVQISTHPGRTETAQSGLRPRLMQRRFLWPALAGIAALTTLMLAVKSPTRIRARTIPAAAGQTGTWLDSAEAPKGSVNLWFKDFSSPHTDSESFDATNVDLWHPARTDQPGRITVSEPAESVANSHPDSGKSWNNGVDAPAQNGLISSSRRLDLSTEP